MGSVFSAKSGKGEGGEEVISFSRRGLFHAKFYFTLENFISRSDILFTQKFISRRGRGGAEEVYEKIAMGSRKAHNRADRNRAKITIKLRSQWS